MADTFYSLATSATRRDAESVVVGAATVAGTDIELRIEDAAKWTDIKLWEALQAIYNRAIGNSVQKDRVVGAVDVKAG